jgi:hypothetical protein
MSWLLRPDPDLNYFVIALCFSVFTVAAIALYAAEASDALGGALSGWWLIPAPAAPGLVWVLLMHALQSRAAAARAKAAKAA